ncbi:GNAT family N-acetyltransferase [Paenibacillus sp. UNC451MF]|uniref:GNAT family N-acetyltransferase n=1 Tax=Paenibacillus sp. UNC451MF TaxID=1449063 RepID=UPI0004918CBF|nr:GNAT family N-acetyltransferase [Paenibacillus sp. UNC451MF]
MLDIRLLKGEEFETAIRLADNVFRSAGETSMGDAFPHVFSDSLRQSYGLFVKEMLVSFIGMVPSVIRIGKARLNIYSIGAVCTHPEHRGKGYAGLILKEVIRHAQQAGACILLVSGAGELYAREGCCRFGAISHYRLNAQAAAGIHSSMIESSDASLARTVLREMNATDWFSLSELVGQRRIRFEQSLWDLSLLAHAQPLAAVTNMKQQIYVAEQEGSIVAFAAVGLPGSGKRQPYVIEYGGDEASIAMLLAHAMKENELEQLDIYDAEQDNELAKMIHEAEHSVERNGGTVRIIDPKLLLTQAAPYLRSKHENWFNSLDLVPVDEGQIMVRYGDLQGKLSEAEVVQLFFDVNPLLPLTQELMERLYTLFPLPFPYTRGLNYV